MFSGGMQWQWTQTLLGGFLSLLRRSSSCPSLGHRVSLGGITACPAFCSDGFCSWTWGFTCFTLAGKAPRELREVRGEVAVLYWNPADLMESVKWVHVCMLIFILSDLIRSSVLGVRLALPKQCSWSFLKLSEADSRISANSCSQFFFSWYFSAMQFLFIPMPRLKSVEWEGELLAQSCSLKRWKFDFVANSPRSPKPHE